MVSGLMMVALCAVFGPGTVLISRKYSTYFSSQPSPSSASSSGDSYYESSNNFKQGHESVQNNRSYLFSPHVPPVLRGSAALSAIFQGAERAMLECQHQFKDERWNCTPSETSDEEHVFGHTLERGSPETAFLHAITSAGIVHAITEACSSGNLTDCSCDRSRIGSSSSTKDDWKWGGCSDNVRYGMMFTKHFVDQEERKAKKRFINRSGINFTSSLSNNEHPVIVLGSSLSVDEKGLQSFMNIHNNHAGRLAVSDHMQLKCRCHGISGSCELKTCWRTLPSFHVLGNYLKDKYKSSGQVNLRSKMKRIVNSRRSGSTSHDQIHHNQHNKVRRRVPVIEAPRRDLVYINKSPNYCIEDSSKGILGTSGRTCSKTSDGPESCKLLCCGRGYNTMIKRVTTRCDCKFEWCCNVTCNICESESEIYTCK